ncbi:MAG: hypothetical protein AVDCRST_MAG30-1484, partial [uncultured Solirubrobacteraceae bacterium]
GATAEARGAQDAAARGGARDHQARGHRCADARAAGGAGRREQADRLRPLRHPRRAAGGAVPVLRRATDRADARRDGHRRGLAGRGDPHRRGRVPGLPGRSGVRGDVGGPARLRGHEGLPPGVAHGVRRGLPRGVRPLRRARRRRRSRRPQRPGRCGRGARARHARRDRRQACGHRRAHRDHARGARAPRPPRV